MSNKDELIPIEIIERLFINRESKLKVWREFRKLTQKQLSNMANISFSDIIKIENSQKPIGPKEAAALANILGIDIDDLTG